MSASDAAARSVLTKIFTIGGYQEFLSLPKGHSAAVVYYAYVRSEEAYLKALNCLPVETPAAIYDTHGAAFGNFQHSNVLTTAHTRNFLIPRSSFLVLSQTICYFCTAT